MAASTGEELRIESESRTDEGMTSGEELRIESKSRMAEGMISDEGMTSDERVIWEEEMTSDEESESDTEGEELRIESESQTDEGMTSGEKMRKYRLAKISDMRMHLDEITTSDEETKSETDGIRDQELSDAFVEEELDRWERFLELSPEEALASTKGMQKVFDIANHVCDEEDEFMYDNGVSANLSNIEDGTALFFAVLGRGVSGCEDLHLVFSINRRGRLLNAKEAIALCANLKSNTNVERLYLEGQTIFRTPQMCGVLSEALTTNNTLKELDMVRVGMSPVDLRCLLFGGRSCSSWHPTKLETDLAVHVRKPSKDYGEISRLQNEIKTELENLEHCGLLANVTLKRLHISENMLFDTTSLVVFLSKNPSLKMVSVRDCFLDFLSARGMADALKCNANLETLDLEGNEIGYDGVKLIFESLSQDISKEVGTDLSHRPNNITLRELDIGGIANSLSPGCMAVEPLVLMLETNTSLTCLSISKMAFEPEHWTQQILPALSKNKTLEMLNLKYCGGLTGDEILEALLEVAQDTNTGLARISLDKTGMAEWQGQIDEELRIKVEYGWNLRAQSMVIPTSGRLVLCGFEFAGKTTIRKTMERIAHPDTPRENPFQAAWKTFLRMVPFVRQILYGTDAPRELDDRTRGFDISVIDNGPLKVSLWDFAGQKEYYALHDYLFPDVKNSCFVYVCSCRCPPSNQNRIGAIKSMDKMKEELQFWMRLIASNAKVTPSTRGEGHGRHLPYVHFVLTNIDTLPSGEQGYCRSCAQSAVDDLREKFEGVIELCQTISSVNAHSVVDVDNVKNIVNRKLQEILNTLTEYEICREVRSDLENWFRQNRSNPLMSLEEFQRICRDDIRNRLSDRPGGLTPYRGAQLDREGTQKAILAYLNDVGDIIYPKGFGFIIVNPRWFGIGILGQLIDVVRGTGATQFQWNGCLGHPKAPSKIYHENGFVSKSHVRELVGDSLKSLEIQDELSDDMIELMIKLEMWFKEVPENPNSRLFFPALFDDATESATKGERKLSWSLDHGTVYVGRRLQCMDTATTFLTPGFFPRLQVSLVNYLRDDEGVGVDKSHIKVDRNLIELTENGMQFFVEYSGDIDCFIDILAKSHKSHKETSQFIENHLVRKIRDFCASPQGCQGVLLEEAVIRPLCVKEPHVCAAWKGHAVLVSTLNKQIQKKGQSYEHQWQRIGSETCTDYALDLLKGEGSYSAASSSSTTSVSGRGDDQHKSSKGDELPEYYISVKDIGFQGKLNAWKGLTFFKFHLYCDGDEGLKHCEVKGQPGRDVALDNAEHGSDFSLLKPVVKFLWSKFDPASSMDKWIDKAFDRNSLPAITKKKLEELINSGGTEVPVSEDDLVKELQDHIARTPGRLKKILNVDDADNIWKDFRLSRAEYSTPAGKIGWLCDRHYSSARDQNKLKTHSKQTI